MCPTGDRRNEITGQRRRDRRFWQQSLDRLDAHLQDVQRQRRKHLMLVSADVKPPAEGLHRRVRPARRPPGAALGQDTGDRTMWKKIAIVAGVVTVVPIAAVLGIAGTKPDTFAIQRAATIKAPPERIYATLSDFQRWGTWSPWEHKDPAMKRRFSGAPAGKGAVYAWEGDGNVGVGRMEITEAVAPSKLAIDLDFQKPFAASNKVLFVLAGKGDSTDVTSSMQGPVPYVAKVMHVLIDVDAMVGKDFEAGLAKLKSVAEVK
jgi:uncharacterized protein YndB with AHSA1/START domain